jgi:hypothetical protein
VFAVVVVVVGFYRVCSPHAHDYPTLCDVAVAKCLALLGDIGNPCLSNYKEFVLHQADRFEHVFLVAGMYAK